MVKVSLVGSLTGIFIHLEEVLAGHHIVCFVAARAIMPMHVLIWDLLLKSPPTQQLVQHNLFMPITI